MPVKQLGVKEVCRRSNPPYMLLPSLPCCAAYVSVDVLYMLALLHATSAIVLPSYQHRIYAITAAPATVSAAVSATEYVVYLLRSRATWSHMPSCSCISTAVTVRLVKV